MKEEDSSKLEILLRDLYFLSKNEHFSNCTENATKNFIAKKIETLLAVKLIENLVLIESY